SAMGPIQDIITSTGDSSALTAAERAHLLIYSHAESPSNTLVAYSTNFGQVLLCNIHSANCSNDSVNADLTSTNVSAVEPCLSPTSIFKANHFGIYCLATIASSADSSEHGFLAAGSANGVFGYSWTDLVNLDGYDASPAVRWRLDLSGGTANSLASMSDGHQLIVACNDGCVKLYDLGHGGRLVRAWSFDDSSSKQSAASVLRVTVGSSDSSSAVCSDEAGFVRFLDSRQRSVRNSFQPALAAPDSVARPYLGNWLTCLACRPDTVDWFACGGGPRLAIWHSANLIEPIATIDWQPTDQFTPFCAEFSPCDRLLIGGNSPLVGQVSTVNGSLVAKTKLSCWQTMSIGCLGIGGDSGLSSVRDWRFTGCGLGSRIDVCSQLGYRLFSLSA
ncbi:hypothetical protein BOX15_Mlig011731g1, partial [Macrostomum lignano]